jgi:hypothetical protein
MAFLDVLFAPGDEAEQEARFVCFCRIHWLILKFFFYHSLMTFTSPPFPSLMMEEGAGLEVSPWR